MTLRELIDAQTNNTGLKLYVDSRVSVYADIDYMKEVLKTGDERGNYKVIKFEPQIINDIKEDNKLFMCIYTSNRS